MQPASGSYRLIVRRGPQPNQIYELNKDIITIGRDITNEITINDPECSRHHTRLTRDPNGGGYVIEDLGSTNGTFVNGQRITGPRLMMPGETVGMGETVTLAYEAAAFMSAPAPSAYAPPPPGVPDYIQQAKSTELAGSPLTTKPPTPTYSPPVSAAPPPSPYAPAPTPYAPAPYAAQPTYDPYAAQRPYPDPYGAPPPPYGNYEEEASSGGVGRWLLLGCGCFIVLCVIGAVITLIVIDQTCAWNQEPLSGVLEVFGLTADESFSACQN